MCRDGDSKSAWTEYEQTTDELQLDSLQKEEVFLSSSTSRPTVAPPSLLLKGYSKPIPLSIKQTEHDANNSSQINIYV